MRARRSSRCESVTRRASAVADSTQTKKKRRPPLLAVPRKRSHISGQRMLTVLFDGWYRIPGFEPGSRIPVYEPDDAWAEELNGILARQKGRRDPSIVRGETVSQLAFQIALNDIDTLLALIAAEMKA